MATSDNLEETKLLYGMGALKSELEHLETKANSEGFKLVAMLIGAAVEAMADEMNLAALGSAARHEKCAAQKDQRGEALLPSRQRLQ